MLHAYGVTEAQILESWTLADFHRYRDFAKAWLIRKAVSG